MASLFQACKAAVRNKEGGNFNIGGYDIDIEMYLQQDIDDDITFGDVAFGDNDESKIVLVAGDTITVPAGYTLTPDKPKKSLVIYCNTLVNNGTISMYQKAPNVLPHDYYIIQGSVIGSNRNVIIPAYANNQVIRTITPGTNGNNGTNRNCGSGGAGSSDYKSNGWTDNQGSRWIGTTGSGYAFGGGAGSGGSFWYYAEFNSSDVDSTYPMRGGKGANYNTWSFNQGGVGNPSGSGYNASQSGFGCGGRIIIFCSNFENNGTITVNGSNSIKVSSSNESSSYGGASGAGAVDVFYANLLKEGSITANGGGTFTHSVRGGITSPGKGGNGSITLTQWNLDKVIKEERKMFTKNNWIYLFNNYSQRLREDVI